MSLYCLQNTQVLCDFTDLDTDDESPIPADDLTHPVLPAISLCIKRMVHDDDIRTHKRRKTTMDGSMCGVPGVLKHHFICYYFIVRSCLVIRDLLCEM